MGGLIDGGARDVIPASLPANPMYDPVWKAETNGRDPTLPVICLYCAAQLGIRKDFGGTYDLATETHDCVKVDSQV